MFYFNVILLVCSFPVFLPFVLRNSCLIHSHRFFSIAFIFRSMITAEINCMLVTIGVMVCVSPYDSPACSDTIFSCVDPFLVPFVF